MNKYLFNAAEDGGTYQLRTNTFKVLPFFQQVLNDFDMLYDSYQDSSSLFTLSGSEEIVLVADCFLLDLAIDNLLEFEDEDPIEHINSMSIHQVTKEILCIAIENESSINVSDVIAKLAQPNQEITIQLTDTLYGNSEFLLST
jgi:uncharacterized protein (UPF0254 family)